MSYYIHHVFFRLLYVLKISKTDPKTLAFNEAYSAVNDASGIGVGSANPSSWPIMTFLGFIFIAPYIIMKLMGSLTDNVSSDIKDPKKWLNSVKAHVQYNFDATNPNELSIRAGQVVYIAPKEIQTAQGLINTGWALATTDNKTSGVIPINYVRGTKQMIEPPSTNIPVLEEKQTNAGEEDIISN